LGYAPCPRQHSLRESSADFTKNSYLKAELVPRTQKSLDNLHRVLSPNKGPLSKGMKIARIALLTGKLEIWADKDFPSFYAKK
jgi:hypothetical protein